MRRRRAGGSHQHQHIPSQEQERSVAIVAAAAFVVVLVNRIKCDAIKCCQTDARPINHWAALCVAAADALTCARARQPLSAWRLAIDCA
jgi:monomeric isocitrate dehydrogenase